MFFNYISNFLSVNHFFIQESIKINISMTLLWEFILNIAIF